MRFPDSVGCVHVSDSATVYFFTISNPAGALLNTTNSPSSSRLNARLPALTMAALPAWRGSEDQRVLPVLASALKYWPMFRLVRPKSASPIRTLLLRRYGMSAFSQALVMFHWLFCFAT